MGVQLRNKKSIYCSFTDDQLEYIDSVANGKRRAKAVGQIIDERILSQGRQHVSLARLDGWTVKLSKGEYGILRMELTHDRETFSGQVNCYERDEKHHPLRLEVTSRW